MSAIENTENDKNFPEDSPYKDTPFVEIDPVTGGWILNSEIA